MDNSSENGHGPPAAETPRPISFGIVELPTPASGRIGLASMPGMLEGRYRPDRLNRDLDALRDWGAAAVLSLMEPSEVEGLAVEQLSYGLRDRGIGFLHVPLPPDEMPDGRLDHEWERLRDRLASALAHGQRLVVQCLDGRGRSGIATARLLIDTGCDAEEALDALREACPGALSEDEQVASVRAYAAARR